MAVAGVVIKGCGSTVPDIYQEGKTRAQLVTTLASIVTHPHPGCPPPYTTVLHLLQGTLSDSDPQVRGSMYFEHITLFCW